jgi:hypothetical protein
MRLLRAALGALVVVLAAGRAVSAQAAVHRNVATLALQHGVVAVDALSNGHVLVGASTDSGTATINLPVFAAREFTDSTKRIVAHHVAVSRHRRIFRSVATDGRTGAGISFARHVTRGVSVYRFFFSRADATGFPLDVSSRELGLVLRALQHGVRLATTLTAAADTAR